MHIEHEFVITWKRGAMKVHAQRAVSNWLSWQHLNACTSVTWEGMATVELHAE